MVVLVVALPVVADAAGKSPLVGRWSFPQGNLITKALVITERGGGHFSVTTEAQAGDAKCIATSGGADSYYRVSSGSGLVYKGLGRWINTNSCAGLGYGKTVFTIHKTKPETLTICTNGVGAPAPKPPDCQSVSTLTRQ